MRMAAYHRAPVPTLPTVSSPPSSPSPSQTLPQSAVTAALDSERPLSHLLADVGTLEVMCSPAWACQLASVYL